MSTHEKVFEEILPNECIDGMCEHQAREVDCPPVEVEVCSECRVYYEDRDMVLLTLWEQAERQGHQPLPQVLEPADGEL